MHSSLLMRRAVILPAVLVFALFAVFMSVAVPSAYSFSVTPVGTGTITITKISNGGTSTFNFSASGTDERVGDFQIDTSPQGGPDKTFSNIQVGTYTVTEGALPSGWTFTDLQCTDPTGNTTVNGQTANITLDANETVHCTYTNTKPPQTGSIQITKYSCPADTVVTRTANGVGGTVPEGCVPQTGATFGYVHGSQTDANSPYPELNGPFVAGGATDGSGVLTIADLVSAGRYLVAETDGSNQQLAAGDILGLYCQGDGDTSGTNDNQELTFVPAGGTAHCVAYDPAPTAPAPQCNANASQVIVSDTTTQEDGHNSSLVSVIHSRWTAVITGLEKWIWGTDPYTDPNFDAVHQTSETFTKTFVVLGTPLGATLNIAADNTYDITINGHEINTDNNEDNYSAAGQDLNLAVPAADLVVGTNTIVVTVTNLAQSGGTPHSNPAGLLYSLTVNENDCNTPPVITVDASKVICTDPSQMPHWGAGGHGPITSTTAQDWVNTHDSCSLVPGWSFQYGNQSVPDGGNATIGPVAGYTTFGPTNTQGVASVTFPIGSASDFRLREVLQSGYIPFTFDSGSTTPNGNSNSAEFYCANDVLNYDNYDFIRSPQATTTYYCVAFNSPVVTPPSTSTVTMCKVDTRQNPLAGWTLTLKGSHVGSVSVNSNGATSTIPGVPAGSYVLTAGGEYTYRADAVASTSDAAYSYRLASDPVYGGPYAPWVRENNFPTPNTGWLGVMLNSAFTDWGSVFNPEHVYVSATTTSATSNFSFNILDDNYSDNSGSILVDLDQGYAGVTGENGCTTFDNVPYGTYTAGELAQQGWSNVSGLGKVTVDQPAETFTVVNHDDTQVTPTTLKVHIFKYLDQGDDGIVQVPDDAGVTPFPMTATWSAANIGAGSGSYVLGDNHGGASLKYAADTSAMSVPADYTTSEVVGGDSQVLPEGSECSSGKYVLEGYRAGDSLAQAESGSTMADAPDFTGLTADKYVIVVNKECPAPAEGTLTIVKDTNGGDGKFNFSIMQGDEQFDSPTIATTEGTGHSDAISLDPGTYDITEIVPGGWTLESGENAPVCTSGEDTVGHSIETNPYGIEVDLNAGEDVTCTFTNSKNGITQTSQTITVKQGDLSSSYSDAFSTGKWFFADDQHNVVDNTLGSFVDGPDTAPLNDGSAQISVTDPSQGVVLGSFALAGTPLSEVDSLAYSTFRSAGDSPLALALQFDINPDITVATTSYDGRLVYEPYYTHTVSDNTWQTWNPEDNATSGGHGNWWFSKTWIATETGCTQASPCTWAQVLSALPHIGIGGVAGGTYFKAGSNWSSDFTGNVDKFAITVDDGSNATTTTYDFEPTVTPHFTADIAPPGGGGGGGGGGPIGLFGSTFGGVVLGTSTEAGDEQKVACNNPLLTSYLRIGKPNPVDQVDILQAFLNGELGLNLSVSGFFDTSTEAAVESFQTKYASEVLTPWGISAPTGYVYKTTRWKINQILCPNNGEAFPTLP